MGVSNHPLHGARLDGLLNILFGGPRKFLANHLNHADSFLVLTQINVWHPLAHSCIHFEDNCIALRGGYNPVSLCVVGDNVPRVFKHGDGQ